MLSSLTYDLSFQIELLGFRLSEDPRLLTRAIRLLGAHLALCETSAPAPAPAADGAAAAAPPASAQVERILATTVFPALACLPCNPGVANELWHLMQPMPYPARFRVYSAFKAYYTGAGAPSEVGAGTAVALSDTKKVLRRLSKENVKEFGRRLAKPTHSQPILVALTLVTQARAPSWPLSRLEHLSVPVLGLSLCDQPLHSALRRPGP